ncbi:heme lyase CcmF/NrfE family subunit [Sphingomonas sp.]|uniref:heme lyase CcmF/NrfE family subunit n=1 Tax=Sphingomonas sp. TaxID=28214 RepID=UPI001B1E662A|nr:heme lyase CcmF/NrfE family subunit [Sphingomonas sp.]MBO9712535.1 heme lyase CcmF/NrfE family subunit [Sphingomonas sp.]
MIAEGGLAALWLAAMFALTQLVLAWGGARGGGEAEMMLATRKIAVVQGAMVLLSFGLLVLLFVQSDMSVALVATNSHSMKPLLYKVAGTWGNHEGSMLLWVTVLGLSGAGVALLEKRLDPRTLTATLGAQAAIALGFYAFLLLTPRFVQDATGTHWIFGDGMNPFRRLDPAPPDGQGLNPLLQDPGLAFHPPTLYLGYVGLSVAFSFAVGALLVRDVGPAFARAMRPWVLAAWIFLTIGITAGSYWAYYELGWGGWWFWDPVENASLMPWLAATALLHSVTVLATRDGLRAWTLMLAVLAFSMSMIGTFLVRSGILVSVHAFAVDPARGSVILGLLTLYIGGALALFGLRVGTVAQGATFRLVSREGALVVNNLLLSVILGVVFIGTLYPLVAQAAGVQLSIGPPFFNKAIVPVTLALVAVTAAGPLLKWRRDNLNELLAKLLIPVAAAGLVFVVAIVLGGGAPIAEVLGLAFAAGLAVASVRPLFGRRIRLVPLHTWGMVIAHVGVAVSIAGMASDSAFKLERLAAVRVGETTSVGPFQVRLEDVHPAIGPNWSALEARLSVTRGEGAPFLLLPQQRYFSNPPTTTTESAISTEWDGQLYTVLGQGDPDGRWQLRLWWKPFVTLIWAGGFLIALGGLIALVGRVRREVRTGRLAEAEDEA